jgi:hypothetical protein
MKSPDHIAAEKRVVREKEALDDKIFNLGLFVAGDLFATLEKAERSRLTRQLRCMKDYSEILGERIANF